MKLYFINSNKITIENLQDWHSTFSLIPFISIETYDKLKKLEIGVVYETFFSNLFLNGSLLNHQVSNNIESSDILIYPFKLNDETLNVLQPYITDGKKIITFYFNDDATPSNLPENIILYRSSLYKSLQKFNERCLPYLAPDQKYSNQPPCNKIGFVGRTQHGRLEMLNKIKSLGIEVDFIYRDGYWHHWANTDKKQIESRREYNKNLTECKYQFCYRGNGNFSYRFTEILSFGRIPILIDTDTVLPFENVIDWEKYIIFLKYCEIDKLPDILKSEKYSCQENRTLWEDYFSPCGYFNNFLRDI